MPQISLFPDNRCGWCGGPLNSGAPAATVCTTCAEEAKRLATAKPPKVRAHVEYDEDGNALND